MRHQGSPKIYLLKVNFGQVWEDRLRISRLWCKTLVVRLQPSDTDREENSLMRAMGTTGGRLYSNPVLHQDFVFMALSNSQ